MKFGTSLGAIICFAFCGFAQVGVGTTNPQATLHIEDAGSNDLFLVYDEANDTTPFVIDEDGNVAIKAPIDTNFTLNVGGRFRSAGIEELSDIRYKRSIETITNALGKVLQIRGVTYAWNQEKFPNLNFKEGLQLGLIAQELEKVVPEAVNTDADGYKSVEYSHLVGLLTEAIKDQQELINKQEAKLTKLQQQLENQGSEIKKIQALLEANNQ